LKGMERNTVMDDFVVPHHASGLKRKSPKISIVVPVYREEGNIRPFIERMAPVAQKIGSYEIIFCLDPSPDRTEEVICQEAARNPRIGLIKFSRRFGQPKATMAGILNCRGETCVVIDVDLQDPPELIVDLYEKCQEGYDVVCAQRRSREGETIIKLAVAKFGYWLINRIADVEIPRNTGDFRILTRRVIEELRRLPESHGFLRGLVAFVGFRQTIIQYDRAERANGAGKYNKFFGSMRIALNGVIGFSTYPLSLLMWSGIGIAFISSALAIVMVLLKLFSSVNYPTGIPTITILLLFMGGVQLTGIGVLGEYIGRIYEEVRRRPRYIVEQSINMDLQSCSCGGVNK
jgi:glycosyltransferase involved in cell wall biosynthesis